MRGNEYIYGLDDGIGFTGLHLSQTHQAIYIKYTQLFICQSYCNQVGFFFLNLPLSEGEKGNIISLSQLLPSSPSKGKKRRRHSTLTTRHSVPFHTSLSHSMALTSLYPSPKTLEKASLSRSY